MPINESLICYATIGTEKMVKRKKTALIELEKTKRKLIFCHGNKNLLSIQIMKPAA
jgi:hypothetical protein